MADLARGQARDDLQGLRRRIKALEDAVKFGASSTDRVGRATVEAGRDFLIRGLLKVVGTVSMVTEDGTELVRIGDMLVGRGFEMKRDDGTAALQFSKTFTTDTGQRLVLLDRNEQPIVSENRVGPGLGRPQLPLHFQPVAVSSATPVACGPYGHERTTSSGTFETLFACETKAQNQLLDFKFMAMCSDGTTEGEIQVVDLNTGIPRPGFLVPAWLGVIPAGTTAMTAFDPASTDVVSTVATVGVGGQMRLGVQARVTAGAGFITLSVPQSIGG